MADERLDKLLSNNGAGSRTDVKKIIRQGVVTVNDTVIKSADFKVKESDIIAINGQPLKTRRYIYIIMNKPQNILSASTDKKAKTVIDLLPNELKRKNLFPVGRLDKDTEGLMLITDDGMLAHKLLAPKSHIEKTYYLRCDIPFTEEDAEKFSQGIIIDGGYKCKPAKLTIGDNCDGYITITEGKFHQIKRMCYAVSKQVVYLKRISMGSLTLPDELLLSHCRELTDEEINNLKRDVNADN